MALGNTAEFGWSAYLWRVLWLFMRLRYRRICWGIVTLVTLRVEVICLKVGVMLLRVGVRVEVEVRLLRVLLLRGV